MKIKENKPINQIPVPVVGMSSSHPSKFKLSQVPTYFRNRDIADKTASGVKLSNRGTSFKNRKRVDLFKANLSIINDELKDWKYDNKDIMDLKKLYFKGWLLSR